MAIRSIQQLKEWFRRGCYPTEQQFADWMDSYIHREEQLPISGINGLAEQLLNKYPKADGEELARTVAGLASTTGDTIIANTERYGTVILGRGVGGYRDAGRVITMDADGKMPNANLQDAVENRFEGGIVKVTLNGGTADAGKVPMIGSDGKLSPYVLPDGIGSSGGAPATTTQAGVVTLASNTGNSTDAGKVPMIGGSGKLHPSVLPEGIGGAGEPVYIIDIYNLDGSASSADIDTAIGGWDNFAAAVEASRPIFTLSELEPGVQTKIGLTVAAVPVLGYITVSFVVGEMSWSAIIMNAGGERHLSVFENLLITEGNMQDMLPEATTSDRGVVRLASNTGNSTDVGKVFAADANGKMPGAALPLPTETRQRITSSGTHYIDDNIDVIDIFMVSSNTNIYLPDTSSRLEKKVRIQAIGSNFSINIYNSFQRAKTISFTGSPSYYRGYLTYKTMGNKKLVLTADVAETTTSFSPDSI